MQRWPLRHQYLLSPAQPGDATKIKTQCLIFARSLESSCRALHARSDGFHWTTPLCEFLCRPPFLRRNATMPPRHQDQFFARPLTRRRGMQIQRPRSLRSLELNCRSFARESLRAPLSHSLVDISCSLTPLLPPHTCPPPPSPPLPPKRCRSRGPPRSAWLLAVCSGPCYTQDKCRSCLAPSRQHAAPRC